MRYTDLVKSNTLLAGGGDSSNTHTQHATRCPRLNTSHASFHTHSHLARAPVLITEMCRLLHFLGEKHGLSTLGPSILQTDTHTHTRCQHIQIPEDSHMGIRWQKRLIAINVHSSVRTSVKWTLWLKASSKSQPQPERDTAGQGGENEMGRAPLSQAWHQKSHAEERPVGSAVLGRWMGSPQSRLLGIEFQSESPGPRDSKTLLQLGVHVLGGRRLASLPDDSASHSCPCLVCHLGQKA